MPIPIGKKGLYDLVRVVKNNLKSYLLSTPKVIVIVEIPITDPTFEPD
jgi:hypothetical protein